MLSTSADSSLNKSYKKLKSTLALLHEASIYRDKFTYLHEVRVGQIATILGRDLGLPEEHADILGSACCFHDIGKFSVPDHILHKTGALSEQEFTVVKNHCHVGAAIFKKVSLPFCDLAGLVALMHHEKMDGTGYPMGLKGHQIPIEARIIGVADVYDALRSTRDYKLAYSHAQATHIMTVGDHRTHPEQFDEKVLRAFYRCSDQLQAIYEKVQAPARPALNLNFC